MSSPSVLCFLIKTPFSLFTPAYLKELTTTDTYALMKKRFPSVWGVKTYCLDNSVKLARQQIAARLKKLFLPVFMNATFIICHMILNDKGSYFEKYSDENRSTNVWGRKRGWSVKNLLVSGKLWNFTTICRLDYNWFSRSMHWRLTFFFWWKK